MATKRTILDRPTKSRLRESAVRTGMDGLPGKRKGEIDEDLIEAYRGTESLPFEAVGYGRVAVKIVDDRRIESLRILEISQ
ncbi:MAG: hypothetical protein ACYC6Y_07415 [Thermoguttaceae bacterium]